MSWKKVWFILFLAALVTWFWPLDKSAQAIDLQRFEATGQIHVLGVNEFTSTPGFFDRDEKHRFRGYRRHRDRDPPHGEDGSGGDFR
jgi:hypothetical protein